MTAVSAPDLPLHLRLGAKRGPQALNDLRIARHLAGTERTEPPQAAAEARQRTPDGKTNFAKQANASAEAGAAPKFATRFSGSGEAANAAFSFGDLLDIVNPLQHLPVVSDIYREMTGDEISPPARVIGGALFGGPIGAAASLVNAVIEQTSGKDMGGHALALLGGPETPAEAPVQLAGTNPAATLPAPRTRTDPAPAPEAQAASPPAPAPPAQEASPALPARTAALPALSPEAFDALLQSVNDPDAFAAVNTRPEPAETGAAAGEKTAAAPPADPQQPADPLTRLARSLDKYEAVHGRGALADRLTGPAY